MSGGRVELGLGAGWNEPEHRRHGLPFPDLPTRIEMLEEQLEVVAGLWSTTPGWSFQGRHYTIEDAQFGPPPVQRPRPPLITGTQGKARTVRLAARLTDHLNLYYTTPERAEEAFVLLDSTSAEMGRDPGEITRSVLLGTVIGENRKEADRRLAAIMDTFEFKGTADDWRSENGHVWLHGTPDEALTTIRAYEEAGVELVVFQDFLPGDLPMIDLLGSLATDWATEGARARPASEVRRTSLTS
jgi:alkanesulfonate monooxygenase SsuD/methylene tetrahydromethanopterin reductase-like flavin-dependent oxidoreductase (luciferase family)